MNTSSGTSNDNGAKPVATSKYSNLSEGITAVLEAILAMNPDISEEDLEAVLRDLQNDEQIETKSATPIRPDQPKN